MAGQSREWATKTSTIPTPSNRSAGMHGNLGTPSRYARHQRDGAFRSGRNAEETAGIRLRREAGQWVRARLRGSAQATLAIRSGIAGLAVGAGLAGMMGWPAAIALVAVLAALEALRMRCYARDRFTRLLKGAVGERFVGGLTECAITAPGCAVAHSVTKIADIGDIDHLVVTPGVLWVVETKYRKVPNGRFAEVLRRISVNAAAVQGWAPPGFSVRGCLVLATANEPPHKRTYEDGRVEVFDPKSLARRLNRASTQPAEDEDLMLARRVRALACEESAWRPRDEAGD